MKIVWTALPNRIEGTLASGKLHVSIFVAPRLDGNSPAGTIFEDWPKTLQNSSFSVEFDGGIVIPATVATTADSALWTTLLGGAKVQPFAWQDNAQREIWSFSVDDLMAGIEALYDQAALAPNTRPTLALPAADPVTSTLAALSTANDWRLRQLAMLRPTKEEKQELAAKAAWSPFQRASYLAKRFYARRSPSRDAGGNIAGHPPVAPPVLDFHRRLAILADHPFILRKLGIVIDLIIPVGSPSPKPLPTGFMKVVPNVPGAPPPVTPNTAYEVVGSRFSARPMSAAADAIEGLLPLSDTTRFSVHQAEIDSDALKVVDFAVNMIGKLQILPATAPPLKEGLPARRTCGFTITRKSREQLAKARFARQKVVHDAFVANAPINLYAEDVARGYRLDVRAESGAWASLHRRVASYVAGGTTVATDVADEAFIKGMSVTSDPDPAAPTDMFLHEAVFGWDGWSLAVGRPGRVIPNPTANGQSGPSVVMPSTPPPPSFPLDVQKKVAPGSLVGLRYGTRYAFRARLVDLAGNGLAWDDPSIAATPRSTTPQRYLRNDVVPPPTIVLRFVVTEGESVEHLVIRSDGAGSAQTYAQMLNTTYSDPAFPDKVYRSSAERHLAPPKTTQIDAETHGMFDRAFLTGADRQKFYRLATREEGTFADKRIASLTVDSGYIDGNPNGARIVTPPQVPRDKWRATNGGPDTSSLTERRGDPLAPGEYVVCEGAPVYLPYLPDPVAAGAVFFQDGASTDFIATTFSGTWPEVSCQRLALTAGPSIGASLGNQAVVFTLPPATILKLRYASTPAAAFRTHMAYWTDHSAATDVARGRHWLMTPDREITLVHAVPRPLAPPMAKLDPSRLEGDTFVTLRGTMTSHSRSTNHVDILASWDEYLDLPTRPLPNDVPGDLQRPTEPQGGIAFQVPIAYGADGRQFDDKHELGDTKHRRITYSTLGTTRYREYFPLEIASDPAKLTLPGTAEGPTLPASPILIIKSSARPAPPKIEYVVPTFRWDISADGKLRKRVGNGLRVYMPRGWYSSGEGEKLAAIAAKSPGADEATLDRCSRWGRDPMWQHVSNPPGVTLAAFKNGAKIPSLFVSEMPGTAIDVAAFDVEFNAERGLWFCDIEMATLPNAYTPFVRLALARYQKESLPGLELSPIVRADLAQLFPDRTLTVSFPGRQNAVVTVKGIVAAHASESYFAPNERLEPNNSFYTSPPRSRRVRVYVQQRMQGSVGDLGWSTTGAVVNLPGYVKLTNTSDSTWSGSIGIPDAPSGTAQRIVVEEVELLRGDDEATAVPGIFDVSRERVVYVDTIAI